MRPSLAPPPLQRDLGGAAKASESVWTLEDGTQLHIQLAKAEEGQTWGSALQGHELQGDDVQADQTRLLLERFQEEVRGCAV